MWLAIIFAVLASGANNVGKALQRKGTKTLPQFSPDIQTIFKYCKNKTWALGVGGDLIGSALMVSALSKAPVSIIQPVSGGGLMVLAFVSHFAFNEKVSKGEWLAVSIVFIGIIGIGIATSNVTNMETSVTRLILTLLLCFILLVIFARRTRQNVKHTKGYNISALYGVFSGCFFALSSTAVRSSFVVAERTGQKFMCSTCGMVFSVLNTSTGFVYQTIALKEGNAVMVSTMTTVTTMMMGMVLGIVALGEGLPPFPFYLSIHMLSCTFIALGSLVLGQGSWDFIFDFLQGLLNGEQVKAALPTKLRYAMVGTLQKEQRKWTDTYKLPQ